MRTKRLVRCYCRVPQQSLGAGDPPHAKAMLTTPPARSDGFDHKGGSERWTYSQGPTGRQGGAWFGGAWFGGAWLGCRPCRALRALGGAGMRGLVRACPTNLAWAFASLVARHPTPEHAGVTGFALNFAWLSRAGHISQPRAGYSLLSSPANGTWRRRSIVSCRMRTISMILPGATR